PRAGNHGSSGGVIDSQPLWTSIRLRRDGGLRMTSTMKGSLVLVALLAAPSVVFGAQRDRFDRRRMQAEIRRDVQESLRDARRMRWEAGRRIRRDAVRARFEAQHAARAAVREARRAAR